MWKLVFAAVCLMVIRTPCAVCQAASTPLYDVICKSTTEAVVTLKQSTYTLRTSDVLCTPTLQGGTDYTITGTGDCTFDKTFIVEERNLSTNFWSGDAKIQEFKLTCNEEDNGDVNVAIDSKFKGQKPTEAAKEVTGTFNHHYSKKTVSLLLLKAEPKADKTLPDEATTETLGAELFLTIVDATPDDNLIPLNCTVKKDHDAIPLWQLGGGSPEKCSKEPDIIKAQFGKTKKTTSKSFIYLKMQAFKFADSEKDTIISCAVRVCKTIATGLCLTDSEELKACSRPATTTATTATTTTTTATTTTTIKQQRRRREVGDSASPHGRVHYLTTTLRVFDNVMEHGTSGSTTMRYTLPVLLMAMLAKLIL